MTAWPKISIVFPTFGGLKDTKKCLSSIEKLSYPQEALETIVVDNRSPDETVSFVQKNFPWVKLLPQKENLGFAKAVNLGIRKAKGEYLLITNNDVLFEKNYLARLVKHLQQNPRVGVVGGKVYYQKPRDKIDFPGAKFNFYTGLLRPNKKPDLTSPTDWVPGCNMLVRRSVLDEIGSLDEKFFFYFEDLDFCLRAKKAGYRVVYYPKAVQWHGVGESIDRRGWQKKSEFYYQGKTRLLFKHATPIQLISAFLFQFFLGLPYHFLILKRQNYPPAVKALVKNIRDLAQKSP